MIGKNRDDFYWFLENYDKLYEEYGHKFLAIKNKMVLGAYDSLIEAIRTTSETEELRSFIVQECDGSKFAYKRQRLILKRVELMKDK